METLVFHRDPLFSRVRMHVVTNADGNEVFLSRGQFWKLIVACIAPAIMFAGSAGAFAWRQSDRTLVLESVMKYANDQLAQHDQRIDALASSSKALERIDQRLIDIERRLGRMEGTKP